MSDTEERIKALRAEAEELIDQASVKKAEADELERQILRGKWNLQEHVTVVRNREGEFLVDSIKLGWGLDSKPWLKGRKRTKSGFHKSVVTVYEWEVVESALSAAAPNGGGR